VLLQPERINPELNQKGYNVKSDVWSLGITMVRQRACASTVMLGSVLGAPTLRWCVWLAAALPVGQLTAANRKGKCFQFQNCCCSGWFLCLLQEMDL